MAGPDGVTFSEGGWDFRDEAINSLAHALGILEEPAA
jgi:hypothetical protein